MEIKPPNQQKDKYININILGNYGVGKSSSIERYIDNKFSGSQIMNIGIDFKTINSTQSGEVYKIRIWDISGQNRRDMSPSLLKRAHGIILMYSIDNRDSFTLLNRWIDIVQNYLDPRIPKLLVGQKCDLEQNRAVSFIEGSQLAISLGFIFYECSSKESVNIKETFDLAIQEGCVYFKRLEENPNPIMNLKNIPPQNQNKCMPYI